MSKMADIDIIIRSKDFQVMIDEAGWNEYCQNDPSRMLYLAHAWDYRQKEIDLLQKRLDRAFEALQDAEDFHCEEMGFTTDRRPSLDEWEATQTPFK